jgi:hypothetical protein
LLGDPSTLIESQLFGHEAARSPAPPVPRVRRSRRRHAVPRRIGDCRSTSSRAPARWRRTIRRVGGSKSIRVDVRVIARRIAISAAKTTAASDLTCSIGSR